MLLNLEILSQNTYCKCLITKAKSFKTDMKKTFLLLSIFTLFFTSSISAQYSKSATTKRSTTNSLAIDRLKKDIPNLMKQADVPGMSVALIQNGKLVWSDVFGVKNAETREPVTQDTIFEAASLSKPVVAYTVLKLIDEGKMDLDTPLNKYLGNNYDVGDNPRLNFITARRILSHTSGFPNWRSPKGSKKLVIYFEPGEKFLYSGEGIIYISKVVEKITQMKFEAYVEKAVFKPLEMNDSSFVWQDRFADKKAYNHDSLGELVGRDEEKELNAAASMLTTADDYAKFVIAVLEGRDLKSTTKKQMFTSQILIDPENSKNLFWGLGFGMEETDYDKTFWHWGDNGNTKAFVMASNTTKDGIVFFANGANGLSFINELVEDGIGGKHKSISWLNYETYDSPGRTLLKTIVREGSQQALKNYRKDRKEDGKNAMKEWEMNRLGYLVLRLKKVDDAIEVFKQNVIDFPQSPGSWDSLAEAYLIKGDKELALVYYKKALELDPENKTAVLRLEELNGK